MKTDESGKPSFFINQMMTRAIWEIERYRWDEYKDMRAYKAKVIKVDDDYVDCILAAGLTPPPYMDKDEDDVIEPTVYYNY